MKGKNKSNINFRTIATIILSMCIILFSYSACRFLDEIKLVREYNKVAIEESNNATFTAISGLISSISLLAEDSLRCNLKFAGEKFSREEKDTIPNSFNNGKPVTDKLKIISSIYFKNYYFTHVNNRNNDIFICNKNGIVADYSKDAESVYTFIPWGADTDIRPSTPSIKGEVLDKLLDPNDVNTIIFKDGNEKIYSMDDLKEVYINGGIEEFKNYNVLVPVYISSDLKSSSANYGTAMNDYSVIVVQEFNIYDQIMNMQPDLGKYSSTGFNENEMDEIISVLYMLGFCLLIGDVVFITLIIHIHNGYICKHVHCKE